MQSEWYDILIHSKFLSITKVLFARQLIPRKCSLCLRGTTYDIHSPNYKWPAPVTDTFLSVPRVFAYEILTRASTVFNLNNEGENCQNLKAGFFKNNMGWRLFHLSKKKCSSDLEAQICLRWRKWKLSKLSKRKQDVNAASVLVFIRLLLSR